MSHKSAMLSGPPDTATPYLLPCQSGPASAERSAAKRSTLPASAARFCFCGSGIVADVLRRLVPIDFIKLAKCLAGVALAAELGERNSHVHETMRRARAARLGLVIIVEGDRSKARFALVEIGASEEVLRIACIAVLRPFLGHLLQLRLRLGVELRLP